MLLNESIQKATKRIAKKYNITYCKFEKVNSVSLEHVVNKDKVLHSFFLFFVTATSNNKEENVVFTNIKENKEKIIPSDYKLIKNDLRKEISIKELFTQG